MELTENQQAAMQELLRIGYDRAARALSELTGRRITLELPEVAIYPIQEIGKALGRVLQGQVATVHQVFSGPLA